MLKINLLPVRQLKKRAKAQKQFYELIAVFLAVVVLLVAVGFRQAGYINTLKGDVATLTKKKDSYSPILKKIAMLKKTRDEFKRKTDVIKRLKKESSLTVRALDEVANRIDNRRAWLESLNQQKSSLVLKGIALDNQTVAKFMDNLKESPFIGSVTLTNSSLKVASGRNLKAFSLTCAVSQPLQGSQKSAVIVKK